MSRQEKTFLWPTGEKIGNIVKTSDVSKNSNHLKRPFILTLKNYGMASKMAKARFVAQVFNDKNKPFMIHDTCTLRQLRLD